jgi:hypothetical protein
MPFWVRPWGRNPFEAQTRSSSMRRSSGIQQESSTLPSRLAVQCLAAIGIPVSLAEMYTCMRWRGPRPSRGSSTASQPPGPNRRPRHPVAGAGPVPGLPEVLQQLHQEQISDRYRRAAQRPSKAVQLRSADAMDGIDPSRGIDDDRDGCCSSLSAAAAAAAARCRAARSSSQRSWPRRARIAFCCCSRTKVRSSSCTGSIRAPLRRWI